MSKRTSKTTVTKPAPRTSAPTITKRDTKPAKSARAEMRETILAAAAQHLPADLHAALSEAKCESLSHWVDVLADAFGAAELDRIKAEPRHPMPGPLFPCAEPLELPYGVDLFPNVRTLADLGLTEARAWALSNHTHCIESARLDDYLPVSRLLFNSAKFLVTLCNERDESESHSDVYVWRRYFNRLSGNWDTQGYCIGAIDLRTGLFVDNIDLSERYYHGFPGATAVA